MNTHKNASSWPRRKARAFIEWAMWDRRRFITVLSAALAVVAIALTIAITSVALSVQNAVDHAAPSAAETTPAVDPTPTNWATRDLYGNEKVTATTTLAIPPASAGPEAAARNFAEHYLKGAHIKDFSDERRRWVLELTPLMTSGGKYFLDNSRQESTPIATITNAKTTPMAAGLPGGTNITTFDLSDASIMTVETVREFGTDGPWRVSDYRTSR